ncbi:alpha/beta fold hydrolase [Asanoa ishikariensis]|uniref:alpha/beta fold hydrolase n=1 Tax=Asanoa ishikariensis TaxID=137265 RepID=UPI0019528459|nr:alpha/beta fold hydrolase [Asanoa ishikariensis]
MTRYLGTYGSGRVKKAALLGAIPPFLLKTDDNPEGVDGEVFEGIKSAIVQDRYAYFKGFLDNLYNVDKLMPERISEQAWEASFQVAAGSSPFATYACVDTWLTDFRPDLPKIDVPVLVVHGTEDRILPYEATAKRLITVGRRQPGRRRAPGRAGGPGRRCQQADHRRGRGGRAHRVRHLLPAVVFTPDGRHLLIRETCGINHDHRPLCWRGNLVLVDPLTGEVCWERSGP